MHISNCRTDGIINRLGFTLIELLVVVAIIALLVSILVPSLTKAREQAKMVVCLSNERQMGLGMTMYANDNSGWYPPHIFSDKPAHSYFAWYKEDGGYQNMGLVATGGYHTDLNALFCPTQRWLEIYQQIYGLPSYQGKSFEMANFGVDYVTRTDYSVRAFGEDDVTGKWRMPYSRIAVGVDAIYMAVQRENGHPGSYNVFYSDGSALKYADPNDDLGLLSYAGGLDGAMYRVAFREYLDIGN